jgi:hypothetical protein
MNSPFLALCASLFFFNVAVASDKPHDLLRVKAYEGEQRAQAEVATVFTMDGRPHFESGYICKVDDISTERDGTCASVLYLLPGTYRVHLRYQSRIETGDGEMTIRVEAGKLYQINLTSLRTRNRGMATVIPMSTGRRLTYRNLAPGLAANMNNPDEEVPYAPN